MILPAVTMAGHAAASMSRLSRSSMLNVLGSDYIKMARVKGNPEWRDSLEAWIEERRDPGGHIGGYSVGGCDRAHGCG